jgi:hypothetical protein
MIQLLVKVAVPLRSPTCQQAFVLFIFCEEIVNCFGLVTFRAWAMVLMQLNSILTDKCVLGVK